MRSVEATLVAERSAPWSNKVYIEEGRSSQSSNKIRDRVLWFFLDALLDLPFHDVYPQHPGQLCSDS
eukprot:29902-Eustigmatos_ZCMA.PRE.1